MIQRVDGAAGYVLHSRPFSETSVIIEVLTPSHGRLGLMAKGARAPRSRLRGVLLPGQPLSLGWREAGELGTLTLAEPVGPALPLPGEALICAWYAHEILMALLPRRHPDPLLFAAYASLLTQLPSQPEPALRGFEWALLHAIDAPLHLPPPPPASGASHYCYQRDAGWQPADAKHALALPYVLLLALAQGQPPAAEHTLQARRGLKDMLAQHLAGKLLKTPDLLRQLRAL